MFNPRQRPIFLALAALVVIWVVTFAGYQIAQNVKITPDKVRAYIAAVDFGHLSAADRAAAIQKLAALLNALTLDERQSLRLDHTAFKWFSQMTEDEIFYAKEELQKITNETNSSLEAIFEKKESEVMG